MLLDLYRAKPLEASVSRGVLQRVATLLYPVPRRAGLLQPDTRAPIGHPPGQSPMENQHTGGKATVVSDSQCDFPQHFDYRDTYKVTAC